MLQTSPAGSTDSSATPWRRVRRVLMWLIGAPLALLLLVFLAWVVSNLKDAAPLPVPAELALPAPRVPDERNVAFALMGLFAASASDPSQVGREKWATELARTSVPPAGRSIEWLPSPSDDNPDVLKPIVGAPWDCGDSAPACIALWLTKAPALAAQREAGSAWGRRCEALLDGAFEFEEPRPTSYNLARNALMPVANLTRCERWFSTGAVLAFTASDRAGVVAQLTRAHRLRATSLQGAHSLMAHMVAIGIARRVESAFTELALRDASLAPQLAALLSPMLDQREAARRWIRTEAAFSRAVMDEMTHAPASGIDGNVTNGEAFWTWTTQAVGNVLVKHHIGYHPERTQQLIDQRWLRQLQALAAPGGADVASQLLALAAASDVPGQGQPGWAWRNTMGQAMADMAAPAYQFYFVRQADAELHAHLSALVLALQANQVPAAQREAFARTLAQKQALPPHVSQRLTFTEGGRKISAKPWAAEPDVGGTCGITARCENITVTWPN